MSLERYYTTWHVQGLTEKPNPFPAPPQTIAEWSDKSEIQGLFVPRKTDTALSAGAERLVTTGIFATNKDTPLSPFDVLRSDIDNLCIKLLADPKIAPGMALSQIKTFVAEVVERGRR